MTTIALSSLRCSVSTLHKLYISNKTTLGGITFCQLHWLRTNAGGGCILMNTRKINRTSLETVSSSSSLSSSSTLQRSPKSRCVVQYMKYDDRSDRNYCTLLTRLYNGVGSSPRSSSQTDNGCSLSLKFCMRFASQRIQSDDENVADLMGSRLLQELSSSHEGSQGSLSDQVATDEGSAIAEGEEEMSLSEMSRAVYNLAPYVHKSQTLQNLLKLGVDLSKVERVKGMASLLVMSDFDKDILPYLRHLVRVGVAPDKLGYVLSTNPLVLTQYVQDLEQRVGYLVSKEFTMSDVASMYTRAPVMILMDPLQLDQKLAFLQQAFGLTDADVRQVALTFPKILPWKKEKISAIRSKLKEFMGFEEEELRLMLLREPKLFTADIHKVEKTFDYVHNTMLIPHTLIVKWPSVLRSRLHRAKGRHLFLLHLGRAQYDPRLENYISMKSLLGCNDGEFCQTVAKATEDEFHAFLKTV